MVAESLIEAYLSTPDLPRNLVDKARKVRTRPWEWQLDGVTVEIKKSSMQQPSLHIGSILLWSMDQGWDASLLKQLKRIGTPGPSKLRSRFR